MANPSALTIGEAAKRLAISVKTLRRMAAANQIRIVRVSTRRLAVPESEIVRLLAPAAAHEWQNDSA